ncbi:MAG: prepilin-type N-terminal cleavage/methylation domain-containing protein [Phycisphaerales bacterium]|nr:prepilin-type N-terminal cleavage/methylation domain-containing protein [Phycisphaerales bacterium]
MRPSRARCAFTFVEMLAVIIILGLLAATSVPAMTAIDQARQAAASNEIERLLIWARARAMASARPTGISYTKSGGGIFSSSGGGVIGGTSAFFTPVEVLRDAATSTTTTDVFGQVSPTLDLPATFAGATVSRFTNGNATTGVGTVWFNYRGDPHTRTPTGVYIAPFTQDALFTLSTGRKVRIRMYSGAVEQE